MRIAVVLGIVIVAASSCLTAAEARGRRGGGGGWSGGSLVSVGGYTRRDGTYVAPYVRTKADGDPTNNLSYRGGSATPGGVYTRTASADPAAAVGSVPEPVAPGPTLPWCSDGTIVCGFCVLN